MKGEEMKILRGNMRLNRRSALITGSTSEIGLAMARALANEGANIVLNGFGDAAEIEKTGNTGSFPHATIVSGFGECVAGLEGLGTRQCEIRNALRYPAELTTKAIRFSPNSTCMFCYRRPGVGRGRNA